MKNGLQQEGLAVNACGEAWSYTAGADKRFTPAADMDRMVISWLGEKSRYKATNVPETGV